MTAKPDTVTFEVEALDTLFFRDARPFTKSEENWAQTIFPPSPSVFYGALRTLFFAENVNQFNLAGNDNDPTKELKITGIYLAQGNTSFFPAPLDCIQKKFSRGQNYNQENKGFLLDLYENPIGQSSCPLKYILMHKGQGKAKEIEGGYLDEEELFKYLRKEDESFNFYHLKGFLYSEPKIGIGISKNWGTSQEEMLYRTEMIRTNNLSFVLRTSGLKLPEQGVLRLGGEGKTAYFKKTSNIDTSILNLDKQEMMFKIYFATPAIFEKGWLPRWIEKDDDNCYFGSYKGLRIRLLAAALGRYQSIGGFDMKKGKPKPMYRAVPAGSVYYFKLEEGTLEDAVKLFHDQRVSDYYQEQGFGWSFVGRV
ncbi:type III-B CRISPR module-associated protein Cmr3 [Anaerobranca gottschalkii]|uniref:CRISPR-associated protein Cmr3 n=1 Tax=Anaerobranca gottschalkii DSM 13577 TaxID=1120990 RepID=A0A1I0C0J9_9FIRM|nr:type III-B CRISPR module-associated protein Cmr3 [Anaerobranca gottschalkii]SET12912.1 CRISPR-associated protein Cmr3 [Anaerobranca gottschalkii DSM 13577]